MMAMTHGAIGAVTYAAICALSGVPVAGAGLGAAAIGALLPDADTPHSRAGFFLPGISHYLERKFGHRTVTHSALGVLVFAALIAPLWFWPSARFLWWPLFWGFISHILADAATKSGVPIAWPNRAAWVFPGNRDFRVKTGSRAEFVVLLCFLGIGALCIPVERHGWRRLLHMAQGSLPGAVRDAEDYSDQICEVELEGYDVLSQTVIEGKFPLIGRRADGSLIIERNGARYLVGESATESHSIKPRRVRVHGVKPLRARPVVVEAANITISELETRLLKAFDEAPDPATHSAADDWMVRDVTLSGRGEIFAPVAPPSDVPQIGVKALSFEGNRIEFDFATRFDLMTTPDVVIKSATLTLRLPNVVPVPNFKCRTRSRVVTAHALRRHADLLVKPGQILKRGADLCRTFGQTIEHPPTPDEQQRIAAARLAARSLRALEVETRALKGSTMWAELRPSYALRRDALAKEASYQPPKAQTKTAPIPARAPFSSLVQSIQWEPPTIPSKPGEIAEHSAQITLVEVNA